MKIKAMFIGEELHINNVYDQAIKKELNSLADVYPSIVNRMNLEEHMNALEAVEVAFSTWGMPTFTEAEIQRYFPKLQAVFYAAGSVQAFARPFLHSGIQVFSAWAANAVPVAEYTAAQILLANKGFFQCASKYKGNRDEAVNYIRNLPGNYRTKVGIIGAGMIGKKVIELLKPHQLEIYVFDPYLPEEAAARMNIRKAQLEEIFSQCQTISNHLANLPATVGILNKNQFDLMLPYATFINTGRGQQVVEADLIHALRTVSTRTAILDVTDPEPVHSDSELLMLDNVILTPHIAGSMNLETVRMARYMADEFHRYLHQEELRFSVSLEMLQTMA